MCDGAEALFPLSAICHYTFCPRRCALVHAEQAWQENYFTASGRELHAVVDVGESTSRRDRRIVRSLRLVSRELGVGGVADVVEFVREDDNGVSILNWKGRWRPYPVEYKWGTAKNIEPCRRQLCAQAICLEEIFGIAVGEGALYLGATKHRVLVSIDDSLRAATRETCLAIRHLLASGITPPAVFGPHCHNCSLAELCMPYLSTVSASQWLNRQLNEAGA